MDKLRIFWPHPKVEFNGRGISEAWAEAICEFGFEPVDKPDGAELAFFVSDSQLNADVIEAMPTVSYFWGWPHERMFDRTHAEHAQRQLDLMARCTMRLVPSMETYHQLCDWGMPSVMCLPGVDTKTLDRAPAPLEPGVHRLALGEYPSVLFISRLAPHKNLDVLIQAISLLDPVPLLGVIGPGDAQPYLELARELSVRLLHVPDASDEFKVELLKKASVLVHPSLHEGFGLPPLEAAWLRVPSLVMDMPYSRWLYQEDVYFAQSPEGMAGMIKHVLDHPIEARARAANLRKRIESTYTMEHAAARLWAWLHRAHKEWWAAKVKANLNDKVLWRKAYEAEHRRNWAYVIGKGDGQGPARFDPMWKRHWRAQYMVKALKDAGAKLVLDVGCGPVYPTIFALEGFDVVAVDIAQEALDQVKEIALRHGVEKKILCVQGDAHNLAPRTPKVDAVVLGEILEHLPDPDVVLAEAMKCVESGGVVLISTPIGSHHYDPYHIGPSGGGWDDKAMNALLKPYKVLRMEKIAEAGTDPSCYFAVVQKEN